MIRTIKSRAIPYTAAICLAGAATVLPAETPAGAPDCKRAELAWTTWLDFTLGSNPGIGFVELQDPHRARMLAALSCAAQGADCPPDHVYAFHCEGNTMALVVYVKNQCVTLAEELEIGRFLGIVGGDYEC